MSELGNQPKQYRPPADDPNATRRCAICHTPLLMAPLGATAGLCPGLSCLQIPVLTAARLRDFNLVANTILSGRTTAELEAESLITWLAQVPPKAPPKPTPIVLDDGSPRYVDWRPDLIIGGDR